MLYINTYIWNLEKSAAMEMQTWRNRLVDTVKEGDDGMNWDTVKEGDDGMNWERRWDELGMKWKHTLLHVK